MADLVSSKGGRQGGTASRIEREFVNPMRIIGLSMPPEYADDIRDSQFAFEKAMSKMTKVSLESFCDPISTLAMSLMSCAPFCFFSSTMQ